MICLGRQRRTFFSIRQTGGSLKQVSFYGMERGAYRLLPSSEKACRSSGHLLPTAGGRWLCFAV